MENWKDVAYLFTNGMFYYRSSNGRKYKFTPTCLGQIQKRGSLRPITLVARKIEDMTDEEILSIAANVRGKPSEIRQRWIDEADINPDNLSFGLVRHLLSCGVYPGPQSHFKPQIAEFQNGEKHVNPAPVIDISKL